MKEKRSSAKEFALFTSLAGAMGTESDVLCLYQQYRFVQDKCTGKDLLEIGCSIGRGLGYLARTSASAAGVDIHEKALRQAQRSFSGRDNLLLSLADAHQLPFAKEGFDVVLIFQAIYLMEDGPSVIRESHRVLKPEGKLIIATVNPDRLDFSPCLHSTRYFTPAELADLLKTHGFDSEIYGSFPLPHDTAREKFLLALRVLAARLHLMPKTVRYKRLLKKLFYGTLVPLEDEVRDGRVRYVEPVRIRPESRDRYNTIFFTVSRKSHLKARRCLSREAVGHP